MLFFMGAASHYILFAGEVIAGHRCARAAKIDSFIMALNQYTDPSAAMPASAFGA